MKTLSSTSTYFGHAESEPLGLEYIAGNLSKHGYEFSFISRYEIEVKLSAQKKNVSLFSATSPEWNTVLKLNKKAKERGNTTVVGGYHITGTYKTMKNIPFDYAVIGEGDEIVIELLKAIENNSTEVFGKRVLFAPVVRDLNKLPFPYRDIKQFNEYKITDLNWPAPSEQINTALILGTRGCRNNCSFCASSSMWGTGIRFRSPQNIIDEIKQLQEQFGTNHLVFVDQSLGQDKEWTEKLCVELIKSKVNIKWYFQTNLTLDHSLIPLLAEAGCSKIGFGLEGISPLAVKKVKPVHMNAITNMNELFRLCNDHGILTKAYLILGFLWETKEIIDEYFQWITEPRVNAIKISYFTPFVGTREFEKYKDQLITNNWDHFDLVQMPVVHNPNITVAEYDLIRTKLLETFYLSETFKETSLRMLENYPQYTQSYKEFLHFLKEQDMLNKELEFNNWLPIHQLV